jgi:hypothetical protein
MKITDDYLKYTAYHKPKKLQRTITQQTYHRKTKQVHKDNLDSYEILRLDEKLALCCIITAQYYLH